jgi:hypothetical protein
MTAGSSCARCQLGVAMVGTIWSLRQTETLRGQSVKWAAAVSGDGDSPPKVLDASVRTNQSLPLWRICTCCKLSRSRRSIFHSRTIPAWRERSALLVLELALFKTAMVSADPGSSDLSRADNPLNSHSQPTSRHPCRRTDRLVVSINTAAGFVNKW